LTKAHSAAINYLTVLNIKNENKEVYFSTMCLDGTLNMWQIKENQTFAKIGELLFGKNL